VRIPTSKWRAASAFVSCSRGGSATALAGQASVAARAAMHANEAARHMLASSNTRRAKASRGPMRFLYQHVATQPARYGEFGVPFM
jgi:hypothetical protein